jgi:hypothetical protein
MDYELNLFNVYFKDEDTGEIDYMRFRAEDEDAAREKFQVRYPHAEITEIEDCGAAY